jgi:hypothetical protein
LLSRARNFALPPIRSKLAIVIVSRRTEAEVLWELPSARQFLGLELIQIDLLAVPRCKLQRFLFRETAISCLESIPIP